MRKGKMQHYTIDDIRAIDQEFVFEENNVEPLYDLLEEDMLEHGAVMWDNDIEFDKEIIVNGVHEIRYSCMVLYGRRRNGKFNLIEASIQYKHLK